MTPRRAVEVLTNEFACVCRESCKNDECKDCDLAMDRQEVIEAYSYAIAALMNIDDTINQLME